MPGACLPGSLSQVSAQSAKPSLSLSVSAFPQPHWPGSILFESLVHSSGWRSHTNGCPPLQTLSFHTPPDQISTQSSLAPASSGWPLLQLAKRLITAPPFQNGRPLFSQRNTPSTPTSRAPIHAFTAARPCTNVFSAPLPMLTRSPRACSRQRERAASQLSAAVQKKYSCVPLVAGVQLESGRHGPSTLVLRSQPLL